MSCCGEPNKPNNDAANRVTPFNAQPITQQPAPQAGLQWSNEKSQGGFQQPPIPSPPPAAHTFGSQNGFEQGSETAWSQRTHSPPAELSQYNPYASSGSPPPIAPTMQGSVNGYGSFAQLPSVPPAAFSGYPSSSTPPLAQPVPVRNRSANMSVSGPSTISPGIQKLEGSATFDEGKLSISIDFGTTFSGVAYGSSRIAGGSVQQILNWPGSFETFRKIPTCLLYDETGQVLAWGIEAKNAGPMPGVIKCEWFKLFLEPHALRDDGAIDPRLPALPPGKTAIHLITDFLSHLWNYAKQQITREINAVADLDTADVWLTVPAAWDAMGCQMMRDAAISAGLVRSARAGDHEWRERLRIISEPEAAAVHCARLTEVHKLKPNQNFMICDAGGGTVDLAVYKIIGMLSNLEIAEMCARSGANCGSLFLDLRFKELISTLLADHPVHLDAASLANFMENFSETDKLTYMGEHDDDKMFHFTCFNVEDPDDPSVGLINGEVAIPGMLLRREVFDPVVNEVLELIEAQTRKIDQKLDALLLVGGFSGSEYLFRRVQERFASRIKVIARPSDCDTATVRGAAQYGLARRSLVSSVIAPQSYMMKVKLPAEPEDWLKRPAYIRENDAGVSICENRLQYLVAKGAILRKGQRIKTKFCKFSQTPQDRMFVATLFTSDTDKIMRYTDEGETTELCKWTVDLGVLPTFLQNSQVPNANGFYTEFELGLELDSAEVRGVLVYGGQDWGRVVFDFRS
ncbi:actin-like ATPase domain-containing protein [Obba rivulosa]|uniref:Actin-like ATPase domain-containing protein n=1 Tax=Obba rivulosa TaxID=1052685 RepID=A0A8E2ARB6_9APHY|nr:actin-like ATPase domain-containing protein [Obba rivulosa]